MDQNMKTVREETCVRTLVSRIDGKIYIPSYLLTYLYIETSSKAKASFCSALKLCVLKGEQDDSSCNTLEGERQKVDSGGLTYEIWHSIYI